MTLQSPRVLIVDQSLRDMVGHHYEYAVALFDAASAAGIPALVGAHVSAQNLDRLGDSVRPWFRAAWYESRESSIVRTAKAMLAWLPQPLHARVGRLFRRAVGRGRFAFLEASSDFGRELLALISAEGFGRGDHVLVHTLSVPELDSLIEMTRHDDGLPIIHIVLRRDAEEPSIAGGPNGGIRGSFMRLMSSPSAAATLRLYTDTDDLAQQYAALAPGLTIEVLPIPTCPLQGKPADDRRVDAPLRITYLGDARREKGFHLLPALVGEVIGRLPPGASARFVIQSNPSVDGDNPELVETRQRLAAYSDVELIEEPLGLAAFHDLICAADIVLLPYERHAYARRSSGILVQALAAGRVVVVPAGTWMARQVDSKSSVLFESDASLADAVLGAVLQWSALAKAAQVHASSWRRRHNATSYLAHLLLARR